MWIKTSKHYKSNYIYSIKSVKYFKSNTINSRLYDTNCVKVRKITPEGTGKFLTIS